MEVTKMQNLNEMVTVLRRERIGTRLSTENFNPDGSPATVIIYSDWHKVKMTYAELCHDLGFLPEVAFVEVTKAGTIRGTCGKPEEFRTLRLAAMEKGYKLRANSRSRNKED
jgi:hypothetical protein